MFQFQYNVGSVVRLSNSGIKELGFEDAKHPIFGHVVCFNRTDDGGKFCIRVNLEDDNEYLCMPEWLVTRSESEYYDQYGYDPR